MKTILVVWTIALAGINGTSYAAQGVDSGNTGLFRPLNKMGDPITLTLGGVHPRQKQLVQKLKDVKLPGFLKSEMLVDLTKTAVTYSDEVITYLDTQKQLKMVLSRLKKTTTKKRSEDGEIETEEKIEEEYEKAEIEGLESVHIHPVDIVANNLNDTYVAAYSAIDPDTKLKTVVYFNHFVDQMTERELLKLVLHEQAHRLEYLGKLNQSERFVEAWASAMVDYLFDRMSDSEFYNILSTHNLPTEMSTGFENEKIEGKSYYAELDLMIDPSWVVFVGGHPLQLQINTEYMDQYPMLKERKMVDLRFDYDESKDYYLVAIQDYFREILRKGEPFPLRAKVSYSKEVKVNSNGFKRVSVDLKKIQLYVDDKEVSEFQSQIEEKFKAYEGLRVHVPGVLRYFFYYNPQFRKRALDVADMIVARLDEIKKASSDKKNFDYEILMSKFEEISFGIGRSEMNDVLEMKKRDIDVRLSPLRTADRVTVNEVESVVGPTEKDRKEWQERLDEAAEENLDEKEKRKVRLEIVRMVDRLFDVKKVLLSGFEHHYRFRVNLNIDETGLRNHDLEKLRKTIKYYKKLPNGCSKVTCNLFEDGETVSGLIERHGKIYKAYQLHWRVWNLLYSDREVMDRATCMSKVAGQRPLWWADLDDRPLVLNVTLEQEKNQGWEATWNYDSFTVAEDGRSASGAKANVDITVPISFIGKKSRLFNGLLLEKVFNSDAIDYDEDKRSYKAKAEYPRDGSIGLRLLEEYWSDSLELANWWQDVLDSCD